MTLAPVILFVYNRPVHTLRTLEALTDNYLAEETVLYIHSDGPNSNASKVEKEKINEVRNIIRLKQWCKKVYIIESKANKGLADSIVNGVTDIVNKHGKIIVLEDDIVTSKGFLKYMNDALFIYENEEKVMHISGFMHPVKGNLPETFFYNVNSCWGWGTWERAWKKFNNNIIEITTLLQNHSGFTQKKFNKGQGLAFWRQIEDNLNGKIKTWAIFWHAAIYLNNGFALHPRMSLVRNIGMDNTGIHCGMNEKYNNQIIAEFINVNKIEIKENKKAIRLMHKLKDQNSIINKLKRLFGRVLKVQRKLFNIILFKG
ncbi:MAG TPA: glycosyltransferase family 2 protein [Bacteroidales bacterium]|nr:glycosyltransferase family 2 protein [Bacteroidales bacterium]